MRILSVHEQEPNFPASDNAPGAVRYHIAGLWVDALDGEPTEDQVKQYLGLDEPTATRRRIDAEIAALEAAKPGYVRGVREKMLGDEARIDAVRAMCENLPADDPAKAFAMALLAALPSFSNSTGMRNVKALDDAIKAKRVQRP